MSSHAAAAVKSGMLFGLGVILYRTMQGHQPRGLIESARSVYTLTILQLTLAGTCLWGFRSFRAVNALLARRYADSTYQILRPDVLKNRVSALKHLGTGLFLVPASAVGFVWYSGAAVSADKTRVLGGLLDQSRADMARRWGLQGVELSLREGMTSRDIRQFISSIKSDSVSVWKS